MSPFCSVVVPTIGRSTLARAVQSALTQAIEADELEVIVVNDSGEPLPATGWQAFERTRLITTNRRERSVARNAGAAVARGRYLCFLDDDDWLLPGALTELRTVARQSDGAAWLYGGIQVVDGTGRILGEANSGLSGNCLAQIVGGAWAPLQASLIRTEAFFRVGGFDPLMHCTQDLDLCRRIALHGHFANTPATVACLFRGPTWQTSTDYEHAADNTRRSRDEVLGEPGAFARLVESANAASDPAYWFGRLLRVYWSTVHLNVLQRRLFAATSRALFGAASLAAAGRRVASTRYWDAFGADHVPGTLHFIMRAHERQIALDRQSMAQPPPSPADRNSSHAST
jgi:glycosyltransferase involved in cell wall biosynthesis